MTEKCPSAWESVKIATAATLIATCLSESDAANAAPASSTWHICCHVFDYCPAIPSHLSFFPVWNLNLPQLLLRLLYLPWPMKLRVINSTLMSRHTPGRRKTWTSDLFCTAPVDNCQFRSLMFIFIAGQLTATLPWLHASWITSSWRYPIEVGANILTNAGFFWKKSTLYYLRTDNSMQISTTSCTVAGFFPSYLH